MDKIIDLFINRSDAYAVQNKNGTYLKIDQPITEEVINKHLKYEQTIGTYQLNKDNKTKWICYDFDKEDLLEEAFEDAKRLFLKLRDEDKLTPLMEFSGKKGFHVWLFCELADAYDVRKYAEKISEGYAPAEIFPKQTKLDVDGYGNLVKIPLGKHQVSGYNSFFFDMANLDKRLTSQEDSLSILNNIKKITIPHYERDEEEQPTFEEKEVDITQILAEPLFDALINKELPQGQIYDTLIKNASIFLANIGVGIDVARKIFNMFYKGKVKSAEINTYIGWYKNAVAGKYGTFNKLEINSWCWKNKMQELYPDMLSKKEEREHFEKLVSEGMGDIDYLKTEITTLLLQKREKEVTAKLDVYFRENNYIYTTREDEKSEMWIYKEGIYIPQGRTYINEFCKLACGDGYTKHIANEVIAKIEADTYIRTEDFFKVQDAFKIPVLNGIFNIKTKQLEPYTPLYRFFNKINAEYIPGADCINIKNFLNTTLEKDDIKIIQELFGYVLLKNYNIPKSFMFNGSGRNGKSRLLELIKIFLGADNCINIPLQELCNPVARFSTGELFNKMACISPDLSASDIRRTGTFKTLTGGDLVTSDRKFKERIKFVNYAKLLFSANEIPKTEDESEAFFSRWIIINFPYRFYTQEEIDEMVKDGEDVINCKIADRNIMEKLTTREELNGLFNFSIEGLDRLLVNGSFSYSKTASKIKEEYMKKSDSFGAFMSDCIESDPNGYVSKSELRLKYNNYCNKNKLNKCDDKHIKQKLESNFPVYETRYTIGDDTRAMCWSGIKFKN